MSSYVISGYVATGYVVGSAAILDEFVWNWHQTSTDYPESGRRMELGGSYMFSSEPDGPDQRVFTLYFELMKYFVTDGAIDKETFPAINFGMLEDFYLAHRLWKTFTYNHPVYGYLNVKFAKPLKTPRGIPGGDGALEPFTIELVEIP